jgi:CheY-like chemotaxis protein
VLLVEDDLINRKMAKDMLEITGASVTVAENGANALKAMEKTFKPSIVRLLIDKTKRTVRLI